MTQDEQYHRENLHLTFSQRVGAVPLPDHIKPEHLSVPFRITLFVQFGEEFDKSTMYYDDESEGSSYYSTSYYAQNSIIGDLLRRYKIEILNNFPDDVPYPAPESDRKFIADLLKSGEYHEIIDFCEWYVRNTHPMEDLRSDIITVFANKPSAYSISENNGIPFIYPINEASRIAVSQALTRLNDAKMHTLLNYIQEATSEINRQDYAGSVQSSINAVESIARQIAPDSNTLGKAISEIKKQSLIPHPTLTNILDNLNGYANGEEGIRHPLVKKEVTSVKLDEAIYMFGLCAVTADYLASKHQHHINNNPN